MADISRQEAREIVDAISIEMGGLSPEERAKATPKMLKALDSVRQKLGVATQTYYYTCPVLLARSHSLVSRQTSIQKIQGSYSN